MKPPGKACPGPGPIQVNLGASADGRSLEFGVAFRIGRSAGCEVRIPDEYVSRVHAEVAPAQSGWLIRDLQSSNGLYHQGEKVDDFLIVSDCVIRLGIEGPELFFRVPPAAIPDASAPRDSAPGDFAPGDFAPGDFAPGDFAPGKSAPGKSAPGAASRDLIDSCDKSCDESIVARYAERYFQKPVSGEQVVGEHTMYIRRAFAQVQSKQRAAHTRQRRILVALIALLAVIGAGVSGYAYILHRQAIRQREIAHTLFYSLKSLDVEIANIERLELSADNRRGLEVVNKYEARRRQLQANYDQFLSTLHIYDEHTTEQHRLILRVARIFGECELDMPADFESEVIKYIRYWQSSGRFAQDIRLAKEKGYTRKISKALLDRGLPVQFFYLAMQESDFDPYRSGPMTRKGYAKGMWQFIPETGVRYGLHLGPLVDLDRPDPGDERDQVDKATEAAARYMEMLYSTDAQASGLLVMACYNWGEDQVLPLVRSMPLNPRERNFWRLLADHRDQIPSETYNYVFYIVSAAVIGENPRLFGFDFNNPLDEPR